MTTTTVQKKKSNVEVKVIALNLLNEYAAKYLNYERTHFSQFLGKDIFKVDGSVKAKFDHDKLSDKFQMPDGTWVDVHYWFTKAYGYFNIHIKICVNGGSYDVKPTTAFCQYEEMTLTLFEVKDGLVETTQQDNDLTIRYDVAELQAIAAEIKQAGEVYNRVYEKMPHRFTDVFYLSRLSR